MEYLIICLICISAIFLGAFITFKLLYPKTIIANKINEEIEAENHQIESKNKRLNAEVKELQEVLNTLTNQVEASKANLQFAEEQAEQASQLFYSSKMKVAQEKLEEALLREKDIYDKQVKSFQENYESIVDSTLAEFQEKESELNRLRSLVAASVEAAKRAEEIKTEKDFYRIQLSREDVDEIKALREVEPLLRNKEPLNKIIWKCYYEKPTNDLIGRVIGQGTHTGIYKITEIDSQKCYVGQSTSLGDRWKQHIKRGIGAEAPTRNKLYPAMIIAGPENFTFEVVEECDRALLDEREDYWQDYFKAKEFGYSIK